MSIAHANQPASYQNSLVIRGENLGVAVGNNILVKGVSLEARLGEITSIVGANGAGKTTLLKALVGDINYTGSVTFFGIEQQSFAPGSALGKSFARQVAMLPQLSLLNFPFKVQEVIALGRYPHSSKKRVDRIIIEAAAKKMDVTHLLERSYTQLSGGEKQRVQLARVMAQIWPDNTANEKSLLPRLLLLDEPMTSLDPGHQQSVLQALSEFAKTGVAIVLIMHDINLAARYSDIMLALSKGQLVASGTVYEVVTSDVIRQLFGIEVEVMHHPVNQRPVMLPL